MADTLTPPPASDRTVALSPRPVPVDAIEHELTRLRQEAEQGTDGDGCVTRACMSNLIIFCTADESATLVAQEIGPIVELHPARVLLLNAAPGESNTPISAYVSAQCHLTGNGRQICSEHVTVRATSSAARGLPSVARPLLIGDLPTTLWWAATPAPPLGGDLFLELADMAEQVIYDSADWAQARGAAARNLVATGQWVAGAPPRQVVTDLAWRCLKPWRRLISQTLDPAMAPDALQSISDVTVEYGAQGLPEACLLIGWLASCLGWKIEATANVSDVAATWRLRSRSNLLHVTARGSQTADVATQSVAITWRANGRPTVVRFAVDGPGRLAATADDQRRPTRVLTLTPRPRAALVARQLPDLNRDTRFRNALAVACALAVALQAHD